MKTSFFTVIFSILFISYSSAQKPSKCYESIEQEQLAVQRLLALKASMNHANESHSSTTHYVPIRFHLLADDNGEGRVDLTFVLEELCIINDYFAAIEGTDILQFYLKTDEDGNPFDLLNNNQLYNVALSNLNTLTSLHDPQAINVWVVNDDTFDDMPSALGFYHVNRDFIVMSEKGFDSRHFELAHEFGHFFSLLHTYHGVDAYPFIWGNGPAPDSTALGYWLEFANGSNCETAGDFICDTPADYGFYGTPQNSSNCIFEQIIFDPIGDTIHPDLLQIMSLNFDNTFCDEVPHFSFQQMEVMVADYNSPFRNYLHLDATPTPIMEEEVLLINLTF